MRFSMKGADKVHRAMKRAQVDVEKATAAAVYVAANVVMTNAKQRAPIDTGVLRASGYVTLPVPSKNPKVEVGFGGAAAPYALAQHEHTEFKHEVGEAKYLEKAIAETDIRGIVGAELKRRMKDGDDSMDVGEHLEEPE